MTSLTPYRELSPRGSSAEIVAPIDEDLRPSSRLDVLRAFGVPAVTSALGSLLVCLAVGASFPVAIAVAVLFALVTLLALMGRASGVVPRFNAGVVLAEEARSRGRLDEAEFAYRDLLKRCRGWRGLQAIALSRIADLRAERGDLHGALRILLALHRYPGAKGPVSVPVAYGIVEVLTQLGDVEGARRWLSRPRKTTPTTRRSTRVPSRRSSSPESNATGRPRPRTPPNGWISSAPSPRHPCARSTRAAPSFWRGWGATLRPSDGFWIEHDPQRHRSSSASPRGGTKCVPSWRATASSDVRGRPSRSAPSRRSTRLCASA